MKGHLPCALAAVAIVVAGCGPSHNDVRLQSGQLVRDIAKTGAGYNDQKLVALAQQNVELDLIDPESAQYRSIRVKDYAGGRLVCGEVNARNALGGYAGFMPFAASASPPAVLYERSEYEEVDQIINFGLLTACSW